MKKYRKITDDVDEVKAVVPGESSSSAGGKDRELEAKHNETSSTDAASDQTQELRQRTPSEPPSSRVIDSSAVPSPPPPPPQASSANSSSSNSSGSGGVLSARTTTRSQGVLGKRSHSSAIVEASSHADNLDEVAEDAATAMDLSALCEADQGDDHDTQETVSNGGITRPLRNSSAFISPTYGVTWEEVMERECAGLTGQGLKRAEWRVRQRRARESKILRQQVNQHPANGRIQSVPIMSRGGRVSNDHLHLQRLPAGSGGFANTLEDRSSTLDGAQTIHDAWTLSSSLPQPSVYSLSVSGGPAPSMLPGRPGLLDTSQSVQQPSQHQAQALIPPPTSSFQNHNDFASPRGLGSLLTQLSELTSIISAQVQLQRRQQDLTINSIEMLSDLLRTYVNNERNSSAAQGIQQLAASSAFAPQNSQNNH